MLLKRVKNLCAQDKKRKENVHSRVSYITSTNLCKIVDISTANEWHFGENYVYVVARIIFGIENANTYINQIQDTFLSK